MFRVRSFSLATLFTLFFSVCAEAQSCGSVPETANNLIAVTYGTARAKQLEENHGDVWLADVGLVYGRKANPMDIAGDKGYGQLLLGVSRGRVDVRDRQDGLADDGYYRYEGGYTVSQELPTIKGLMLCGGVSLSLTQHSFAEFPVQHVLVPVTIGVAYVRRVGSISVHPYLAPSIAYFTSSERTEDEQGGATLENVDSGRNITLSTGFAVRMGRMILDTGFRLNRSDLRGNAQLVVQSSLVF